MKQKTGRKLLSFLLTLAMVVGLLPGMNMVVYAEPSGVGVSTLPTTAGNYYLTQDITISSTWMVPSGTTILDLNGHGIRMTGTGSVIKASGASSVLTLMDSAPDSIHYISLNNYRGTAVSKVYPLSRTNLKA